jgi:stearoyl-CoA desaturase (delta-9 desaturase)
MATPEATIAQPPVPTAASTDPDPTDDSRLSAKLSERFPHGVNWANTVWLAAMHAGAIAAFWYFSWEVFWVTVALYYATGCFGVTLGYHRLITHTGFITPAPIRYLLTLCAMASGQGSPLFWVSTHRKHHVYSDQPGDPHSPDDGFWWSHFLWLQPSWDSQELKDHYQRWAPDLYREPVQRFFDRVFPAFLVLTGVALYFIGEAWLPAKGGGLALVLWALCLRIVLVYHVTWFVNSASHTWGYQNYPTNDHSTNLWWVGLLAFGEGWHNNHHAYQRMARHGHRFWEFDLTYNIIRVMKVLGLARNVVDTLPDAGPRIEEQADQQQVSDVA